MCSPIYIYEKIVKPWLIQIIHLFPLWQNYILAGKQQSTFHLLLSIRSVGITQYLQHHLLFTQHITEFSVIRVFMEMNTLQFLIFALFQTFSKIYKVFIIQSYCNNIIYNMPANWSQTKWHWIQCVKYKMFFFSRLCIIFVFFPNFFFFASLKLCHCHL